VTGTGFARLPWLAQNYDLGWYVRSLFSSPVEVHSAQLGFLAGLVLAIFFVRRYEGVALVGLAGLVVFALGFPDGELLCSSPVDACVYRPIQGKPWYFMTRLLSSFLLTPGVLLSLPFWGGSMATVPRELERVRRSLGEDATASDAIAYLVSRYADENVYEAEAMREAEKMNEENVTRYDSTDQKQQSEEETAGDGVRFDSR
jgi:hypothetical protein